MNLRLILFGMLSLIGLNSCIVMHSKLMSNTSTQVASYKAISKLDRPLNLMVVEVEINGKTYRFLWDTGAICVIDESLQAELNLKKKFKSKVRDSGGQVKSLKYVQLPELRIANIPFYNVGAVIANLRQSPTLACLKLDGIIGGNLMKSAHWQMDLKNNQLIFSNKLELLEIDSSQTSEIEFIVKNYGTPKVEVFSDTNKLGYVTFDSGFAGFYSASSNRFPKSDTATHPVYKHFGYNSSGLYGTPKTLAKRQMISISLDSNSYQQDLGSELKNKKPLLGVDFMKHYIITIDWQYQKMYMTPIAGEITEPKKLRSLLPKMINDTMVLGRVYQQEPWQGLDCSEKVKSFNGQQFSNLTREGYCHYINTIKSLPDTVSIILENGTEVKSVAIEVK